MQKSPFLFLIILFSVFSSCNFSKGVKKDFITGLSASYNGFAVEDIFLSSDDGRLNSNTVTLGAKVFIIATGVENFAAKEGKVFPGCTIILTDKTGKELLNLPDAFSDTPDGVAETEARTLKATLTTGKPMAIGETYHLKVRFFDKIKNKSEIVAKVDLKMK